MNGNLHVLFPTNIGCAGDPRAHLDPRNPAQRNSAGFQTPAVKGLMRLKPICW